MGQNTTQQTADDKIAQSAHIPLKPAHQAQFHNLLKSFQAPATILLLSLETYLVTFLNPLKVSTHCYFWLPTGSILALLYQHWFQVGIFQLKFMKSFIFRCLQNQNNNRIDLYHLPTQPSSRQKILKIHIYLSSWGHAALMEFMSPAWTPCVAWISPPLIWEQMILLKKTHTDTYICTHAHKKKNPQTPRCH